MTSTKALRRELAWLAAAILVFGIAVAAFVGTGMLGWPTPAEAALIPLCFYCYLLVPRLAVWLIRKRVRSIPDGGRRLLLYTLVVGGAALAVYGGAASLEERDRLLITIGAAMAAAGVLAARRV